MLNRIQVFENEHGKQDKVDLEELKLNKTMAQDPYSGDPLHIERVDTAWKVHSPGLPEKANFGNDHMKLMIRGDVIGVMPNDPWLPGRVRK